MKKEFRIAAFRDAVWADSALSPNAKLVALALARYWNRDQRGCWSSIERLAMDTQLAETTVKKALAELKPAYVRTPTYVRLERSGTKLVPVEFSPMKKGRGWVAFRTLHIPRSGHEATASVLDGIPEVVAESGREATTTSLLPRREEVGTVALSRDPGDSGVGTPSPKDSTNENLGALGELAPNAPRTSFSSSSTDGSPEASSEWGPNDCVHRHNRDSVVNGELAELEAEREVIDAAASEWMPDLVGVEPYVWPDANWLEEMAETALALEVEQDTILIQKRNVDIGREAVAA